MADEIIDTLAARGFDKPISPEEARQALQICVIALVHSCQCQDAGCQVSGCQRLKRAIVHMKICKNQMNGRCFPCKHLVFLCCYHTKSCKESSCPVPSCTEIRRNLQKPELAKIKQKLIQAMDKLESYQVIRVPPTKPWHHTFSRKLRDEAVQKIVNRLHGIQDKTGILDKRKSCLLNYSKKIECQMYKEANTKEMYDQLINEKLSLVQRRITFANSKPSPA